jgi:predicted ATPase
LVEKALGRVKKNDELWFEAEVHRLRGELSLSLSDPTEAEKCFLRAARVAQEQNAKMWQLRATMSLARLWRDRGRRGEAHDLLAPVYDWFAEGFDMADFEDAKALLEELS